MGHPDECNNPICVSQKMTMYFYEVDAGSQRYFSDKMEMGRTAAWQ
jgi:hypothetical protein